jgi:hypothetical protein
MRRARLPGSNNIVILSPEEYSSASTQELLKNAERGYVGIDHRFLRVIFARGESVLPDFVRALTEVPEDIRVDLDGPLIEMVRHLRTPAALPFLAEYARAYEFSFPDELTEAFIDLGAASVATLAGLYAEGGIKATDALFALAGLGVRDPRILELLKGHFEADPEDALVMLGLYGDPAAKPWLEKAIEETEDERLKQELESAIDDLDRGDETHPEPFDIFPDYPAEEPPFFAALDNSELLEFLKSPVANYRARAVRMLAFEDMPEDIVLKVFETAEHDSDPRVRATSWEALEGVHEPAEIEEALRKKLADADAPAVERAGALVALAHEAPDDEAIRGRILELYESPEIRAQAVKAMWHSGDRRFEALVLKALDEPELETRRQAVTAVGILALVSQLGRLERLFEDEELRESALFAYGLAAPVQSTPAHLRKLFRRIENLAGGLDEDESMLVGKALDDRLEANGYEAMFVDEEAEAHDEADADEAEPAAVPPPVKPGRNDPCPCGSGNKFKKCCGK